MENATKALIIAGSVLVAILLITMGIRIIGSTKGTVDSAQGTMDATAITTFNSQFTGYLNRPLTTSQCGTLIQKMIASNATNGAHQVKWGADKNKTDPKTATAEEGTYKAGYGNDGYIEYIYKYINISN